MRRRACCFRIFDAPPILDAPIEKFVHRPSFGAVAQPRATVVLATVGPQPHHDRVVVGARARQAFGLHAVQAAHEAAMEPERDQLGHPMGRIARTHVAEPRQQHRPHEVEVAKYAGARGQVSRDHQELAPVQHLAVRKVHVGDRPRGAVGRTPVHDLADAMDERARGQRQRRGRSGEGTRRPARQAVPPARQRHACVEPAEPRRQHVDRRRRFLHQQEIGAAGADKRLDVGDRGARAVQQVPADDAQRSVARNIVHLTTP